MDEQEIVECSLTAFRDGVIWGHISQMQSGEAEGLATHRQEEMEQTLPQAAPHSGLILPPSILLPTISPEQTEELKRQKGQESPGWNTVQPPPGGLQAPYSSKDSSLGTWGKDRNWSGGAGS